MGKIRERTGDFGDQKTHTSRMGKRAVTMAGRLGGYSMPLQRDKDLIYTENELTEQTNLPFVDVPPVATANSVTFMANTFLVDE